MSQPTRARTTGAATRKPRKTAEAAPVPASALPPEPEAPEAAATLAPATLARTLRAVAAELERDPALARRVADALSAPDTAADAVAVGAGQTAASLRPAPAPAPATRASEPDTETAPATGKSKRRVNESFRPRLITGTSPELGSGIPDPFALYAKKGEPGLRAALAELRLGTLRAIVREHKLDPQGRVAKLNDAEKLREAILTAAVEHGA